MGPRQSVIAAAVNLCLVSAAMPALADTLVLNDGRRMTGTLVSVASRTITFRDTAGVAHRYSVSQVDSLVFTTDHRQLPPARASLRQREAPSYWTAPDIQVAEAVDATTSAMGYRFSARQPRGPAGGADGQWLGQSRDRRVPAEAVLRFGLDRAVNLQATR
jgi:hypothetical protein